MRSRLALVVALMAALSWLPGYVSASPGSYHRDWYVSGGGDLYRTGFNPQEQPPWFVRSGRPAVQPNPEWVTKLSDFPSGIFLGGGLIVVEGLVILTGGATNSIVALDQDTGLPVWRFQPDPRGSKYMPGDGYAGAYPGLNHLNYDDGIVYGTFSNGTLYALDASTGERVWRWEVPAPGAPGEVKDHVLDPRIPWDYDNPKHREFPLRAEVAPYTGDYPKFHSAVNYCVKEDLVVVETLDERVFVIDGLTGNTVWHRYVGAPDWPGEFNWPEASQGGITPESGRSTRRFEARPGIGCLDDYILAPVEDGFFKIFDNDTGRFLGAYDTFHPGDLGWANDAVAGIADPKSHDVILETLSNRMVRLSIPDLVPRWRHTETGGTISICQDRLDRSTCEVLETTEDGKQDGPMGGSVFGGNSALDYQRRILASPNEDGHLYIWKDIDVKGRNPTLLAKIPTRLNPYSKANPKPGSISYYLPRDGKNPPWLHQTSVIATSVMGGGVIYFPATWEHAIYGVQYLQNGRLLAKPRVVFRYEVMWDEDFRYPPFGDTYDKPIVDIDLLTMGGPAITDDHLYTVANDGSVYSFDLQHPIADTQRNLAVLGSGIVPFLPAWDQARGSFDRVWTTADWYKNQVTPTEGWRLPTPGQVVPFGFPVALFGLWLRRRSRRGEAARRAARATGKAGRTGRWEGVGWP
jgi:hypothetical protein